MGEWRRVAVYALPEGRLGDFGAAWLGWDARDGRAVAPPALPGLDPAALTAVPRRYGFHATLKAPFRLAEGATEAALRDALAAIAARAPALALPLRLARLGGFLALVPDPAPADLAPLEAWLVQGLDHLRAPLTDAERARRHPERLTPRQRALLDRWGYPHVLDQFGLHFTLTGPLDPAEAARVEAALAPHLAPLLAAPLRLDALALMGEDAEGRFHRMARLPLDAGGLTATS